MVKLNNTEFTFSPSYKRMWSQRAEAAIHKHWGSYLSVHCSAFWLLSWRPPHGSLWLLEFQPLFLNPIRMKEQKDYSPAVCPPFKEPLSSPTHNFPLCLIGDIKNFFLLKWWLLSFWGGWGEEVLRCGPQAFSLWHLGLGALCSLWNLVTCTPSHPTPTTQGLNLCPLHWKTDS